MKYKGQVQAESKMYQKKMKRKSKKGIRDPHNTPSLEDKPGIDFRKILERRHQSLKEILEINVHFSLRYSDQDIAKFLLKSTKAIQHSTSRESRFMFLMRDKMSDQFNLFMKPSKHREITSEWAVLNGGAVPIAKIERGVFEKFVMEYSKDSNVSFSVKLPLGIGIENEFLLEFMNSSGVQSPCTLWVFSYCYQEEIIAAQMIILENIIEYSRYRSLWNPIYHQCISKHLHNVHSVIEIQSYVEIIKTLTTIIDKKDTYTAGHSERVSQYSELIAGALNLSESDKRSISLAAKLHDIGKISIKDAVLQKDGALDPEEWNIIKSHALETGNILSGLSLLHSYRIVDMAKSHHERVDGTGYPEMLNGNELCIGSKIIAVADAFDAMTSNRVYRKRMSFDQAYKELVAHKGLQFDEQVVDAIAKVRPELEKICLSNE